MSTETKETLNRYLKRDGIVCAPKHWLSLREVAGLWPRTHPKRNVPSVSNTNHAKWIQDVPDQKTGRLSNASHLQ